MMQHNLIVKLQLKELFHIRFLKIQLTKLLYARFNDNIWAADLAEMGLLSSFDHGVK